MLKNVKAMGTAQHIDKKVPEDLFEGNKTIVLKLLKDIANEFIFEGNSKNKYEFPSIILKEIYEFMIRWSWTTKHKHIKFENNNKIMQVLHTNTRVETIGTTHVCDIVIKKNEIYLFEVRYIKGTDMDAIIGLTDNKWIWKEGKIQSLANDDDCFNWGLRYDGVVCWNNKAKEWDVQICGRWGNNDIIQMLIDTTTTTLYSKNTMVKFWINGEQKMSQLVYSKFDIEFPLKVCASAAREGGFEILRGFKMK
eukprot:29355_1